MKWNLRVWLMLAPACLFLSSCATRGPETHGTSSGALPAGSDDDAAPVAIHARAGSGLSGGVIMAPPSAALGAPSGHGRLSAVYDRAVDKKHPTRWRINTGNVTGSWRDVGGVTGGPVQLKARKYGIDFKAMKPLDRAPASREVTVVARKHHVMRIRYK